MDGQNKLEETLTLPHPACWRYDDDEQKGALFRGNLYYDNISFYYNFKRQMAKYIYYLNTRILFSVLPRLYGAV